MFKKKFIRTLFLPRTIQPVFLENDQQRLLLGMQLKSLADLARLCELDHLCMPSVAIEYSADVQHPNSF